MAELMSGSDDYGKLAIMILSLSISATITNVCLDKDPTIRSTYADILRKAADAIETQKISTSLVEVNSAFIRAYEEVMKERRREAQGI